MKEIDERLCGELLARDIGPMDDMGYVDGSDCGDRSDGFMRDCIAGSSGGVRKDSWVGVASWEGRDVDESDCGLEGMR